MTSHATAPATAPIQKPVTGTLVISSFGWITFPANILLKWGAFFVCNTQIGTNLCLVCMWVRCILFLFLSSVSVPTFFKIVVDKRLVIWKFLNCKSCWEESEKGSRSHHRIFYIMFSLHPEFVTHLPRDPMLNVQRHTVSERSLPYFYPLAVTLANH